MNMTISILQVVREKQLSPSALGKKRQGVNRTYEEFMSLWQVMGFCFGSYLRFRERLRERICEPVLLQMNAVMRSVLCLPELNVIVVKLSQDDTCVV